MSKLPEDNALILVCILPSIRDLEIARVLGWYRIPLRTAPKVVQVDYLAFYQTSTFGEEERWRIIRYAPALGNELTTRSELLRDEPEHPHAREEYYKIQIGPLENLEHPILAGDWKRVTFFYTTGAMLKRAQFLRDLAVHNEEREVLWRSLRERALRTGMYHTQDFPEELAELDTTLLMMLGQLDLFKDTHKNR